MAHQQSTIMIIITDTASCLSHRLNLSVDQYSENLCTYITELLNIAQFYNIWTYACIDHFMWCLKITFNFCINFKDWWYHIKITLQILKFVEFDIAQLNVGHFKMKIYSVKIELCRIRCKIHRTVLAYRKQGLCI